MLSEIQNEKIFQILSVYILILLFQVFKQAMVNQVTKFEFKIVIQNLFFVLNVYKRQLLFS